MEIVDMHWCGLKEWWNFHRFWDKPEVNLKRHLRQNPNHPFHETDDEYVFETRNGILYIGFLLFISSGFGGAVYWYQMKTFSNELFDTAFILMFLWSLRLISYNWQKRRIVLEKDGENYFFYVGGKLVYKGDIHNIYFRLRSQCSSNGSTYYRLVLNGYHVEEYEITSMTTNKPVLEQLAKRLAFRLNINYFDSEDVSIGHIVRHVNPQTFYLKPAAKRPTGRAGKRMSVTRATLEAFY
ncbi:cation channel sperm-associated auxiliary subunit TMEM249-like [Ciona intestinalis]